MAMVTSIIPKSAPPSKPAPVIRNILPAEGTRISRSSRQQLPDAAKGKGSWDSVFENAFGGIFAEMLSTTLTNFALYLTQTLADPRKENFIKKSVRLHVGFGGEVGCGFGATEEKGVHYGYPGPVVQNRGDFSLSHYRISNDKGNNKQKENLLYSKFVVNGFVNFEHFVRMFKIVIEGFYHHAHDKEGFKAAFRKYFNLSLRDSICDLENIRINASRQADIVTVKLTIPWNEKVFGSKFPKTWDRVKKIKKFCWQLMEKTGKFVFLTFVVTQNGIFLFCMIYKDKLCLCKLVTRKKTPTSKKEVTLHVPLANQSGKGPRTIDVNHLSPQTFSCRTELSINAVFGMATFHLPWVTSSMNIIPKSMGGVSIEFKILEIQSQSMAEKMFSMILPVQQFRELALKYYDIRLNLGKNSLSRNPIRADKETHSIGCSEKLNDRFLFTYDGLMRLPTFPACLTKIISDMMNDSWEERFLCLRDISQRLGMDLRVLHEKQKSSSQFLTHNKANQVLNMSLSRNESDEKAERASEK